MGTDVVIWKKLVLAILLILLGAGIAVAQTEQRVALVIGNGNYANVGRLRNPANDAKAMAALLRRYGFEVIEQEDVSRRAMIQATRGFAEKLSPGGVGLLFYAGHGIQSQGADYLVPVDASLAVEDDLKYETIDLQDILNKLEDARVRLSIVMLDACRDNPFRSFRSSTNGLALINPPVGTVIVYATAPGKVAGDGSEDHSVFTAELLKAMSKPDKLLDVLEHVTEAVERRTGNVQTPWINSSFRGDFYFMGPTTVTVNPPPAPPVSATSPEIVFWQSIVGSANPADFEAYLKQFPQGSFAALAQIRLASLSKRPVPAQPMPPPEVKNPKTNSAPASSAFNSSDTQKAPPPAKVPLAAMTHPVPPRVQSAQRPAVPPETVASGATAALQRPVTPPAASGTSSQGSQAASAAVVQDPNAQPTQEAMVRPPLSGATQPNPPEATQPRPAVPEARREFTRRHCLIPHFTGFDTGAGAYVTIRVVNTGARCGTHLRNQFQPTSFSLSLSKPPSHGSVVIEGNGFYYTPLPGFVGDDDFAITGSPYARVRATVTVLPPDTP